MMIYVGEIGTIVSLDIVAQKYVGLYMYLGWDALEDFPEENK